MVPRRVIGERQNGMHTTTSEKDCTDVKKGNTSQYGVDKGVGEQIALSRLAALVPFYGDSITPSIAQS